MECNKDYAIKAKEIAERKFKDKDLAGAKKFALKAHKLYPGLEGISQMLVTLDVHAAGDNQILGEADWYGVLGVPPRADDDTVRKQYRKLALALHPDKNKSVGAEGAFKLISQAWSMLSDKGRRAAYDAKRENRSFQQKVKPPSDGSSIPPGTNGFYNFAKSTASNSKANKSASRSNSSTNKSNGSTFWTVCHRCKMQFEYVRTYLNNNLVCPNCQKPFMAIETPPPVSRSAKPWDFTKRGQSSKPEVRTKNKSKAGHDAGDFQWVPFSGAAGASSVAQAANVVQQTYEKVRRVRQEEQAAKLQKSMKRKNQGSESMISSLINKKRRLSDENGVRNNVVGHAVTGSGTMIPPPTRHGASGSLHPSRTGKFDCVRKITHIELHNVLVHKARKDIIKKLIERKSANGRATAAEKAEAFDKVHGKDKPMAIASVDGDLHEAGYKGAVCPGNGAGHNLSESSALLIAVEEVSGLNSISVTDPDFYDFDRSRTEMTFQETHVWAVYDNYDGMPRYYVMVHSIISRDPFKLRISWLDTETNLELIPFGSGFTKPFGVFRVGRHETVDSLNCFSHKVRWIKGTGRTVIILPRKGDVWALYRNWSADWNELTSSDVIQKYEMVEVLEDSDEKRGVVVIPLVKVAGFKAVFHRHLDPLQVRRIPKEEVSRFSHQVPSHLLSGQEGPNAPKGCVELDPAGLPTEFLQVIADAMEVSVESQTIEQSGVLTHDGTNPVAVDTSETLKKLTNE